MINLEEETETNSLSSKKKINTNNSSRIFDFEKENVIKKQKNNIFKKFKNIFNVQIDRGLLILNFFGFFIYFISLIGCHKGEENKCVTDFKKQFYFLGFLIIIDSIILSFTLILIFWKKAKKYHLIYITITYFLFYLYDNSFTLVEHGGYNLLFLIVITLCFLIIINYCKILYILFQKKKDSFLICFITLTFIFPLIINYKITLLSNCKNFNLGLNQTRINNTENDACWFKNPLNCRMDFFYGKFDMTKYIGIINYNTKKRFISNLNKKKYKNVSSFGIPLTIHIPKEKNIFYSYYQRNFLRKNYIDMDKIDKNNFTNLPEVVINFDDKGIGNVNITIYRNETLINERKKLQNNNSLFENVIIVFTDSVSRQHFKRVFKKLGKWIEQFMKYNIKENKNYKSF